MSIPTFTMRQLMEAGAHYGHHTRRWNPKWLHISSVFVKVFTF